jgi:hypothetical protein
MAKNDTKKGRKDKKGGASDAVEALRSAVERTLQEGAGLTGKRTRELVDEVQAAGARIRESFEDIRPLEDLRDLRTQMEHLAARVADLESGARTRVAGAARSAGGRATAAGSAAARRTSRAKKPAAARTSTTSAAKPAARAKKAAAKKRAAVRRTTAAAKKPAASRARKAAARKPAASSAKKPAARKAAAKKPAASSPGSSS